MAYAPEVAFETLLVSSGAAVVPVELARMIPGRCCHGAGCPRGAARARCRPSSARRLHRPSAPTPSPRALAPTAARSTGAVVPPVPDSVARRTQGPARFSTRISKSASHAVFWSVACAGTRNCPSTPRPPLSPTSTTPLAACAGTMRRRSWPDVGPAWRTPASSGRWRASSASLSRHSEGATTSATLSTNA